MGRRVGENTLPRLKAADDAQLRPAAKACSLFVLKMSRTKQEQYWPNKNGGARGTPPSNLIGP
jgi:hypothetical protein